MKSIKDLLKLMLENISDIGTICKSPMYGDGSDYQIDGLCILSRHLWTKEIITKNEVNRINHYIKHNRPHKVSSKYQPEYGIEDYYYWAVNTKPPRIYWLKKHIKLQP